MARTKDAGLDSLWQLRFQRQVASGLSVTAFCAREGVSPAGFYSWKRRLAAAPKPAACRSPLFVSVRVPGPSPDPGPSPTRGVVLELPHRVRLSFDGPPEPEWLARVVAALAGLPDRGPTP